MSDHCPHCLMPKYRAPTPKAPPTPGPWTYHTALSGSENDCGWDIWADGSYVASVSPRIALEGRGDASPEGWANARLIAAAPLLYRELAHLVRLLEPVEHKLNVPGLATLNGARSALAAAASTAASGQGE